MWVIRWRPHWLLFGKKRRGSASDASGETGYAQGADAAWGAGSAWGAGTGFYSSETDHPEWTDMTLRTLSEIDPDWAGHVVMDEEAAAEPPHAPDGYYDEAYEEPAAPAGRRPGRNPAIGRKPRTKSKRRRQRRTLMRRRFPYEDDDFYGTETSEAYAQAYEAPAAYDAAQTYDAAPAYDGPRHTMRPRHTTPHRHTKCPQHMTRLRFRRKPRPKPFPRSTPLRPTTTRSWFAMLRRRSESAGSAGGRAGAGGFRSARTGRSAALRPAGLLAGRAVSFCPRIGTGRGGGIAGARGRACRRGRRTGARKRTASPPPAAIEYRRRSADASPGRAGGIVAGSAGAAAGRGAGSAAEAFTPDGLARGRGGDSRVLPAARAAQPDAARRKGRAAFAPGEAAA